MYITVYFFYVELISESFLILEFVKNSFNEHGEEQARINYFC